jgi:Protein of unknown function (DUF3501)
MTQLSRDEIRTGAGYEQARDNERRATAAGKEARRISLGAKLTLVFESAQTLRHTIEELLRSERIVDDEAIATELEDFGRLVPGPNSLTACLYAHVADSVDLPVTADRLDGIARSLALSVGGQRIAATMAHGDSGPLPVCLLTFTLSDEQRGALESGATVSVDVDHAEVAGHFELTGAQREILASDLS